MTTINDISDLVRILQEQPEWAETLRGILLSKELLRLPETVAALVETTNALTEAVARLEKRTERLEEGQARLEEGQARLEEGQTRLEKGQAQLEGGQAQLEGGQAQLEKGQAQLEEGQAQLEEGQARLEAGLASVRGTLGNLIGSEYERWAARLAPRRVRDQLEVTEGKVLQVSWEGPEDSALANAMESALDQKSVSSEDVEELLRADIILQGRQHDAEVYLVIEASLTADSDDFDRALERAQILQRVTGTTTLPVVFAEKLAQDSVVNVPDSSDLRDGSLVLLPSRRGAGSA